MKIPPAPRDPFRSALTAAALAVTLAASPLAPPAAAQLQQPTYRGFQLNSTFDLVVGGETVRDAEIYSTSSPPAILIMSPRLPAPVLVVPGGGRVETVNLMKLAKRPDGSIDLLPQPTLAPQGRFRPDGQAVEFQVEGAAVRLEPKPPLLGTKEASDLKEYSALYVKRAAAYSPDEAVLRQLKEEPEAVRVRVFFGSWCPMCQRTVPNAVRLSDELVGSQVRFEFYGLPQGFKGEPEATRFNITGVPTGIVFVDGREAGRIEGNAWLQPERRIREILDGGASSGK